MTGNQVKGKGFRGALRYNLEKVEKKMAEVLDHSFVSVSEKSIMKEVRMIRMQRPNLQKYFYHTSINFPPHEDLSNEKMKQIAHDYLKRNGFGQHQFIMFRHHDADHPHLHILVNRIGYDGTVLSDSNDFARSEKVLRELEKKYNLTEVISSREAKERAMTKDELEMMKRTNTPSQKMQLQVLIKSVLQSGRKLTCTEFIAALESKGIRVQFNQASTGYVSGISYSYKGLVSTGAKLGNDFKWTSIKNTIDYEQERDRAAIHETNVRTKSVHPHSRTGAGNPGGNTKTLPTGSGQQQAARKQPENTDRDPAKPDKRGKRTAQRTGAEAGRSKHQPSKSPEAFSLAALLDGGSYGNIIHADHQPDVDVQGLTVRRKKKKRKRRRI